MMIINRVTSIACLLAASTVRADIVAWDCTGGVHAFDGFCWADFADPPGAEDTALFDAGGEYTVLFDDTFLNDRVIVGSGAVTFDLAGGAYDLTSPDFGTPSIALGNDVPGFVSLDIVGGTLSGVFVDLGPSFGSQVVLGVDGNGAGLDADVLHVGALGDATMTVTGGASVTSAFGSIANGSTAGGFVDVIGPGSTWACSARLTAGKAGLATFDIEDGATVTSGEAIIGQQVSALALVTVRGAGSTWTIDGSLDVAFNGFGSLAIEDGGAVTCADFASIATSTPIGPGAPDSPPSRGVLVVDGAGSTFDVDGNLWIGFGGAGTVAAVRGGRAYTAADIRFAGSFSASALLVVGLGGPQDYPPGTAAIAAGGMTDDIDLEVSLLDGYVPTVDDAFSLIRADMGLGEHTLTLPELPFPLAWVVEESAEDIVIRVPNPGDVNGDGVADVEDLVAVITAWGACPVPPGDCPADLNGDGVVDVNDLVIVIVFWS